MKRKLLFLLVTMVLTFGTVSVTFGQSTMGDGDPPPPLPFPPTPGVVIADPII